MNRWIGRSIILVGLVHTGFGLAMFSGILREMLAAGWWNTLGDRDPSRYLAFWFMFAGFITLILGYLADWFERVDSRPLPAPLGWALLGIALVGVIAHPLSGFWLVFPPALGTLSRARKKSS